MFLDGVSQHRCGGSNIYNLQSETNENDENADTPQETYEPSEHSILLDGEIQETQETDDDEAQNNNETISKEVEIQNPKKKRPRRTDGESNMLKLWQERDAKRRDLLQTFEKKKEDDIDLFCRHIGEVLRNLSPIYKAEAKKQLYLVLSEYEIKTARDDSASVNLAHTNSTNLNTSSTPRTNSSTSHHTYSSSYTSTPYLSPSLESAYDMPESCSEEHNVNLTYLEM